MTAAYSVIRGSIKEVEQFTQEYVSDPLTEGIKDLSVGWHRLFFGPAELLTPPACLLLALFAGLPRGQPVERAVAGPGAQFASGKGRCVAAHCRPGVHGGAIQRPRNHGQGAQVR